MEKKPSARKHERVPTEVAIHLENGAEGVTRDLSPTGVFFLAEAALGEGDEIHFSIDFDNPAGPLRMECVGNIVRIESAGGRRGFAVRITESRLARGEEAATPAAGTRGRGNA